MTAPEPGRAAAPTPGQAAYEAHLNAHWDDHPRVWEEIAQAAIDENESLLSAQLAMARDSISDLAAEREVARAAFDDLTGQLAEARAALAEATRRDDLRAQLDAARSALQAAQDDSGRLRAEAQAANGLLKRAADALWNSSKAALTVEPVLKKPYDDDPRWSPWTRWVERPAHEAHDAAMAIRKHLRSAEQDPAVSDAEGAAP